MLDFEIIPASAEDESRMCDIFLNHISEHPEYISHGELQMGVGEGCFVGGEFVTKVSENAREIWMKYIHNNIVDGDSAVYKAVQKGGTQKLIGFCVSTIMSDTDSSFGMVCDVLVLEDYRTSGVGSALLENGIKWLKGKGIEQIYLESGLKNEAAHEYFMRRGFFKVSEIYKLK